MKYIKSSIDTCNYIYYIYFLRTLVNLKYHTHTAEFSNQVGKNNELLMGKWVIILNSQNFEFKNLKRVK